MPTTVRTQACDLSEEVDLPFRTETAVLNLTFIPLLSNENRDLSRFNRRLQTVVCLK
jgi:hypothetical protein